MRGLNQNPEPTMTDQELRELFLRPNDQPEQYWQFCERKPKPEPLRVPEDPLAIVKGMFWGGLFTGALVAGISWVIFR